ncbi:MULTISPECIES: hypothetical protein [unclassified Arthrobacter]|nr:MULTISPECIES: hypothetical protein [unclassified Arthrobacter]
MAATPCGVAAIVVEWASRERFQIVGLLRRRHAIAHDRAALVIGA